MSDYIRKAVELADGWEYGETPNPTIRTPNGVYYYLPEDGYAQECLDALAAQLVRQHLKYHTASVYTAWHRDPLKTIKWLVDDKV